jgi:outer membrane protein assembly factor BamA
VYRSAALFILILLCAPHSPAQDDSRRSQLRAQRERRAAEVAPPQRQGLENALYQFEERRIIETFQKGYRGFHPKLGGLVTGSGFALGTEYRNERLDERNIVFRAAGQASFLGYQQYELQAGLPQLAGGRLLLDFSSRHRNYPRQQFFGIGEGSPAEEETQYRIEDNQFVGTVGVRPAEWLVLGVRGGYMMTNVGAGTGEEPSVETRYDPAQLPGLDRQPDYVLGAAYLDIDYRDSATNPRSGGYYRAEWTRFDDNGATANGFRRVDIEVRQYLPFFNLRRVIAFRARTSLVDTGQGQQVPFFMQPTLGGSENLRGFEEFRFRDRNLFVMNLEYRWEAFSGLDMALFGDAGKVFSRRADMDLTDMEASYGFGARFNSANGVFFRIDTGFSHEGPKVFFKFGHFF